MRRHDSLRTGFDWLGGLAVALITAADDIKSSLIVEDLTLRRLPEIPGPRRFCSKRRSWKPSKKP